MGPHQENFENKPTAVRRSFFSPASPGNTPHISIHLLCLSIYFLQLTQNPHHFLLLNRNSKSYADK